MQFRLCAVLVVLDSNGYIMFLLTESFAYKQEERFDCGVKAGDAYATQRRYPQPFFWDYKVQDLCPFLRVLINFCTHLC